MELQEQIQGDLGLEGALQALRAQTLLAGDLGLQQVSRSVSLLRYVSRFSHAVAGFPLHSSILSDFKEAVNKLRQSEIGRAQRPLLKLQNQKLCLS